MAIATTTTSTLPKAHIVKEPAGTKIEASVENRSRFWVLGILILLTNTDMLIS